MNQTELIQFLRHFMEAGDTNPYLILDTNDKVSSQDDTIQRMIDRFLAGKASLLPFLMQDSIMWLLLCPDLQSLKLNAAALSPFVKGYSDNEFAHRLKKFDPRKPLGHLGAKLFPHGYFVLKTSEQHEANVLNKISMWERIDSRKPELQRSDHTSNIYRLRQQFDKAIALGDWDTAVQTLEAIAQGRYLEVINIHFLRVRLLDARGKWEGIWQSEFFDDLTGLDKIPSQIRHLLLKAYYISVLEEWEQKEDFATAHEMYRQTRHRLQSLTGFRIGIETEQETAVFLHEAALHRDREAFYAWQEKGIPAQNEALFAYLKGLVGEEDGQSSEDRTSTDEKQLTRSPLEQVRALIQNQELDEAFELLQHQPTNREKVELLCWFAVRTEQNSIYLQAYSEYEQLSDEDKALLNEDMTTKPSVKAVRMHVQGVVKSEVQVEDAADNWNRWWHDLREGTIDSAVMNLRLEELQKKEQLEIIWTDDVVNELTDLFAELALEAQLTAKQEQLLKKAIPCFLTWLINQENFPIEAALQVYEYVTEMMERCNKNGQNGWLMLKMIEGLLEQDYEKAPHHWTRMVGWLKGIHPRRDMVKLVMAILELFECNGLGHELIDLWNRWSAALIKSFKKMPTNELQLWYEVGDLIGADSNLLTQIRGILKESVERNETDVIVGLPEKKIVIFTLRVDPARNAITRLKERNPRLQIEICTDTHKTSQAEHFSRNADVVVLVTDAMKHALFCGIRKYLQEDQIVYPSSTGMSGIVLAIEEHFRKKSA